MASADGVISPSFHNQIATTQLKLGWVLIMTGIIFWAVIRPEKILHALCHGQDSTFLLLASGVTFVIGWFVQEYVFAGIPHVTDAISHMFQARIFSHGRLFAPAPECPDAFYQYHILMTHSGMWFTKYTPGHAILLAAGMTIGLISVVVPLSAAATTWLLGRVVLRYESTTFVRVFLLLYALSPLGILLSASYMSHYPALCMAVAGIYFLEKTLTSPRIKGVANHAMLSGFFFVFSAMIRPHEFLMIGLVGFLFFCTLPRTTWLNFFKALPMVALGALPVLTFWGYWNIRMYGDAMAIGYGFSGDDVIHSPFQGSFGFNENFGFRQALGVFIWNLDRINRALFGWPVSLFFIPFALLKRPAKIDLVAWLGMSVVIGVYFFYDYRAEYESRYYFLALAPMAFLTSRGIQTILNIRINLAWRYFAGNLVTGLVGAFYLHAAVNYWPDQIIPTYKNHYYFASPMIHEKVQATGITNAVILIHPPDGNRFVYSSGFIYNDPMLTNDIVYARFHPDWVYCLKRSFPKRAFYLYEGSEDGSGNIISAD